MSRAALVVALLAGCSGDGELRDSPTETVQVPDLGLRISPESRCQPYDADQYRYPQSVELDIIEALGAIYSPYDGQC